ncbi:unnamed protein product [Mytilus coruscus]|uniref:Endonuclease/exonuclease/phosphatase domain-containing protein n=1 Tax=Mytilus coruscus TaxID=42192 RepID=A0A6J8BJC8_MYTCO|nr:unnamed protein product [Mytilus coruscus]
MKFLKSDSEFVQWVKIENTPEQNTSFLLGCTYIPPSNSKYSSTEAFDEIENEFFSFQNDSTFYALVGDFNSRTAVLPDFFYANENWMHILQDVESDISEYVFNFKKLLLYNLPLERFNQDKSKPNAYGYKLLQLCKNLNLFIANGRICQDRYIGRVTSGGCSLIDYLIVSSEIFPFIVDFNVLDFDPLFSDTHSRLHFTTKCYARVIHENQFNQSGNNYHRWVNGKRDIFVDAIIDQQDSIDSILVNLEEVNTPNQDEINNIVNKISNIFVSTARKTSGKKTI